MTSNIFEVLCRKLGGVRETIELLECLFPDGPSDASGYKEEEFGSGSRGFALALLGRAHQDLGHLETALAYFVEHKKYCSDGVFCPVHEGVVHSLLGHLYEAESIFRSALARIREEGQIDSEARLLSHLNGHFVELGWQQGADATMRRLCKLLWTGTIGSDTRSFVRRAQLNRALDRRRVPAIRRFLKVLEKEASYDKDFLCTLTRAKAQVARLDGDLLTAAELSATAVRLALSIGDAVSEALSVHEMACVALAQRDYKTARDQMNHHSEIIQGTSLRPEQAAGQALLAKIEEADGNVRAAIDAATAGFRYGWCDGPPFCYEPIVKECSEILQRLGARLPVLPCIEPGLTEPWPLNEIDPPTAPPRRLLHSYARLADTGWLSSLESEMRPDHERLEEAVRDQDYVATIELADRLLARDHSNLYLLEIRASALWYTGQYERAESDFTHLLAIGEGREDLLAARGQVRAEMGKAEAALDDLKGMELQPYALSGMGLALGQMGRHQEAFEAFQRSIEMAPENAWVYFNRARVHELEHNTEAALTDYRHSLACAVPALPPHKQKAAIGKIR